MELFYFKGRNFGDELNDWLWRELLGPDLDRRPDLTLSVIGTIISDKMPACRTWAVLGSGVGYRPPPADFGRNERWKVLAVRGPLTAEVLGLAPALAITDGAILLAALSECSPVPESERKDVVYMPHLSARGVLAYAQACEQLGIRYLDPTVPSREAVQVLRHARLVIADAMHAAIVADTLRVPWVPVASSRQINSFKWLDWTMSMELEYEPVLLPAPTVQIRWQNRTAGLFGRKFLLDRNDRVSALRDFRLRQAMDRNRLLDATLNMARTLGRKALEGRSRLGSPSARRPADFKASPGPEVESIAAVLRQQMVRSGYLSRDDVFVDRLARMRDGLDRARQL